MAPKRGWCKHCLDDYRHGDVIVRCSSCPRSFHRECLDNDILAHASQSAYYQQNTDNPLDLSDFTCDSCLQYAQETEIVNDERCKICKERNRDETDVLLLCDGCPNSYHMSCLNLQIEPDSDKWYCPMCKPEAFEGVNVRAQRRNPLTDTADHVNSSICYVCQRHGKLLGCDFCSNSFHYDCLPEFDIDTIADVWECPCCRGEDPFLNQMHKRWTISQIEKNSRTRRKSIMTWRGVITRYRNRFILAHRNELSSFVADKVIDQLTKTFISNKNKNKKNIKDKDVESQLELLQEEQLIESNKFVIKARKSCYYPSGRKKDNRPMRTGVSLKPHQEDGVDWLLKSFLTGGAILADEMGLGKTIQTLCFLSYLKMMNIEGPHLIVVPLSTVGNWLREIHRFTPHLTVIKICGSKTERQHAMSDRLAYSGLYDLFVTTYETVKCEEAFFVETIPRWQCLILDEAHRIKNQSGALRHSMDRIVSNMRLLLTGTPLQNNAQELFTLINFMFPDLFRDSQIMEQAFNAKKRLRNEIEMNFTNEELDAIKLLLSKIMLRRLKEQAISLPKKVFHDVWLPLSQETLKWYRTLMNIKSLMNENMSIKKLLGIVIKMRIICGHPRGIVSRSQQLDKLYTFFKQEDIKVQKKVENEANELQNLKGVPHIHASAKLTFLDKLLCQLHYENCRLVPNYHKVYQQHLKALDNSLYRKYTNTMNANNKDEQNYNGLKQQSIIDSFNHIPSVRNIVATEPDRLLKNLTEFTLQVKSENLALLHDDKALNQNKEENSLVKSEKRLEHTNKDNMDVDNDRLAQKDNNMDLDNDNNENNNNKNTNQNSIEDDNSSLDNKDQDNKGVNEGDNDEKGQQKLEKVEKETKYKDKDNKSKKKKKLTKEEVLSKVENEFVRVPASTSGSKLYLSSNLKEVNLTHNCPYVSMKIYENALEQEAKYKTDKKKSTYKFESTRLVDLGEEEQENIMNYVNDPNRKSNKIIESDDEFELDNNKEYDSENKVQKSRFKQETLDYYMDKDEQSNKDKTQDTTNQKTDKNVKFEKGEKEVNDYNILLKKEDNKDNMGLDQEMKLEHTNKDNDNTSTTNNNTMNIVKQEKTEQDNGVNNTEQKVKVKRTFDSGNDNEEVQDNDNMDNDNESDENKLKVKMHKVLIFTQFQLVLDELETYCVNRGWKYMRLDGSTNKLIRELDIREFNSSDSHYFVYLISTRAGGLGINLTAANHVVLYDEDWNPFIDLQAIDRAHRIGQKRDVHIWKLISEWTVEERMALIREKKLQLDKLILHGNNMDNRALDGEKDSEYVEEYNKSTEMKLEDTNKDNNKEEERDKQLKTEQINNNTSENNHHDNNKLLDEDDVIISLSHQAILKMMMHGNKALQHLECEQIIDMKLDEIVERKRKVPPEDLDDTDDIVDDILISKSNQVEGDDRVIIELVKEEDEMDIIQEETEKRKKKKVSGLLVKDLINEEDVVDNIEGDNNIEDMENNEYNDRMDMMEDGEAVEGGGDYINRLVDEGHLENEGNRDTMKVMLNGTTHGNPIDHNKLGFSGSQDSGNISSSVNDHTTNNHHPMGLPLDSGLSHSFCQFLDNTTSNNEYSDQKPRRSRRNRMMMEMEQAGLLWRSVREKKKPNMIYTPVEWQKKGESKTLRHETKCFLCGKPKNYIAKYKDKDDNEVEVDYGELVKCFRCPKSYHKFCERLNVIKRNWCCRWHECCLCFRKSSQCGNLLIHCSNCPTSFCYDCFPPDYTRHYVNDEYYFNLTQRGLVANTSNWIFFLCSKCKIESERKKRSMSGEERDKHKKEQKELRSELLSSIKNKDKEGTKDKKKLKSILNKQEKARIDELKAQEAELEERHRNLYQSLFPVNMITELTNRINNDILNSNNFNSIGRPPKSQDKNKLLVKVHNEDDEGVKVQESVLGYKDNIDLDNDRLAQKDNNMDANTTNEYTTLKENRQNAASNLHELEDENKDKLEDKEEKEDEDWGVGLRAKRRGLNFTNVRLPYKLLQFCDNCRIPLHNVYKNPTPCPFPKESVKLDLEINIRKPKVQGVDVGTELLTPNKVNVGNYDNEDNNNNSNLTNTKDNTTKRNDKQQKTEQDNKEDMDNTEKKIIKKGYCSSCYENRGVRSSHLRRHCEFLTDEDKEEYKHRNELVEKAMKMLESLVPTTSNNIDYSQFNNVKLKSLYNHMLDQCDSLYLKALVDVGLLEAPKEPLFNSDKEKKLQVDDYNNLDNIDNYNNFNTNLDDLPNIRLLKQRRRRSRAVNNNSNLTNTNDDNNTNNNYRKKYNRRNNNNNNTKVMTNTVVNNVNNTNTHMNDQTFTSNIDNKGLADYVRSFNSIYRHRSNRDRLLLPIVYEEPKNNRKK